VKTDMQKQTLDSQHSPRNVQRLPDARALKVERSGLSVECSMLNVGCFRLKSCASVICALLLLLPLWVFSGCGKKQTPPAQTAPPQSGEAPAAAPPPKYVAAMAQNAPAQNVAGEVNAFLTEQLRIFIREKGRLPASFTELARTRLDSVPRPPEGKKWVIDTATSEVKAVAGQ